MATAAGVNTSQRAETADRPTATIAKVTEQSNAE